MIKKERNKDRKKEKHLLTGQKTHRYKKMKSLDNTKHVYPRDSETVTVSAYYTYRYIQYNL